MESLSFQPVTHPWALALLCLCAFLLLFIGPSFANLTRQRKVTLSCLRAGVILLALLGLFRPGCVDMVEKNQAGVIMFLLDSSRSMELPHINDDSTRWAAIEEMIKENEPRFQELQEQKIDVRFFSFDNVTTPLEFADGKVALPAKPEGGETDLGTPIYNSSLAARGERLISVIVASDGVQTVANPEIELNQAAIPLNDMEVPLIGVMLGLADDATNVRDVAIKNFAEQQVVNVKNSLTARATLVARGYPNEDIKVELVIIDSNGRETIADPPKFVRPRTAFEEINVELTYKPTEPGEYRMKVRAVPMPGEQALRNNELDAFLTVNDKGMSVLIVDGGFGFEQSYLRRSLATAEFISLEYVPIYAVNRGTEWPRRDLDDLFNGKVNDYDVTIFSNIDSAAFTEQALAGLTDSIVNRRRGFLMIGGEHSFGPGGYDETLLRHVLPIEMKRTERQFFDQEIRRELHIVDELKLKASRLHSATQLGDESVSWGELPPLLGANRFSDLKENASVLLESDDASAHPLLVGTTVGDGGRVLAFAGDTLWRWNLKGKRQIGRTYKLEYDRFWRQVILFLADTKIDETVSIDFPQRRFQPKGRVKFNVKAQAIDGSPLADTQFKGTLVQPDGTRQVVPIKGNTDDWSELDRELVAEAGLYRLEIEGARNGQSIGRSERQFVVMDRDVEKSNPVANPERMRSLAGQTKEFGGKAVAPEEVATILDDIIANPPIEKLKIPTRWRLGDTFYDALAYLAAFVCLLTVEWFLRKKWGLV